LRRPRESPLAWLDQVDDLLGPPLGFRPWQIDLVEDRDDFEAGVEREEEVGERLSLDPLRRIHDEDRTFAGGEGAGHFVGEVHVSRVSIRLSS
jgi:hypothetical protein